MKAIREIMKELGVTAQYDTAKPEPWMAAMAEQGFDRADLFQNFVWLYDEKARLWGRPFNYMAAYGRLLLTKYAEHHENCPFNDGMDCQCHAKHVHDYV